MLSKSRYLKGLKCHKALWLNHHKREEAYYPESTIQKFAVGNTAGELAQQYFPGGELAQVDDYANTASAQRTQELLEQGVTTIYEATFIAHNTLVALDILHQIDGKWYGFEVKSTNRVKSEHIRDAAIQYYVIQSSGFELEDISIMHFDRNYVRQGDIDPKGLFTHESVFIHIRPYLSDIPGNIKTFLEVYEQDEPLVTIGSHCDTPYECEFKNYCHQLPENQPLLKKEQHTEPSSTEITYKNDMAIQQFLEDNPYPIYSLDFETIMYGIPEFDNSRPYQQIPFQFSLHYQKDADSKPEHFEFLGNGIDDPREALIQQLLKDVGTEGDVLVYSHFENTMLNKLKRDFPLYADKIKLIQRRLVDILPVFRKMIKTKSTSSSASLKVVLPSFLPHLSYKNLDIQHGMATVETYRNLSNMTSEEAEEARKAMLVYCKLDTLAVLELYNKLYEII
jgi:hypothetical protein